MLLFCFYVQYFNFPRADQALDHMEFHTNVLAPRRATRIIRDIVFEPSLLPNISTGLSLNSRKRNVKTTVVVNNTSLGASYRVTYSASIVTVVAHFCVQLFQPMGVPQHDCYT